MKLAPLFLLFLIALGVTEALNRTWKIGFLYSVSSSYKSHRMEFDVALEEARGELKRNWNDEIFVNASSPVQTPSSLIIQQSLSFSGSCQPKDAVDFVLGPEVTSASIDSNTVFRLFNIPQLGYGSADDFSQKSLYPTYNRVVSKSSPQGFIMPYIMKFFGWKKATALATSDSFGQGMLNTLQVVSKILGITITPYSFPTALNDSTGAYFTRLMQQVKDTGNYIIISLTAPTDNNILATYAKKLDMWGPPYTWIGNSANIALLPTGSIGTQFFVNQSSKEWNYFKSTFLNSTLPPSQNVTFNQTLTYQGYFWDGLRLIVRTFDYYNRVKATCAPYIFLSNASNPKSPLEVRNASENLPYVTLDNITSTFPSSWCLKKDSELLLLCVRNISFRGATTQIDLDDNGDQPAAVFSIIQKKTTATGLIGFASILDSFYADAVNDVSVKLSVPLTSLVWGDGTANVPYDSIPAAPPTEFEYPTWLLGLILALTAITICCAIIMMVLIRTNRLSILIRASTENFNYIILVGAIMTAISSISFVLTPSDSVCTFRVWMLPLSVTVMFSPLFVKTYRIALIFEMVKLSVKIPNAYLISRIAALICVPLVILLVTTANESTRSLPRTRIIVSSDEQKLVNECTEHWEFLGPIFGFVGMLTTFGALMAWKVKAVPSYFNESSHIMSAIAFTWLYGVFLIPIQFVINDNPLALAILRSFGTLAGIWVAMGSLYFPKVLAIVSGRANDMKRASVSNFVADKNANGFSAQTSKKNLVSYPPHPDSPTGNHTLFRSGWENRSQQSMPSAGGGEGDDEQLVLLNPIASSVADESTTVLQLRREIDELKKKIPSSSSSSNQVSQIGDPSLHPTI